MLIYKICDETLWNEAIASGAFEGAEIDLSDGYIHFSTAEQARETAAKHFAGRDGLVLIAVEADTLGDALKWEPSRGGALFPHLYRSLSTARRYGHGPCRCAWMGITISAIHWADRQYGRVIRKLNYTQELSRILRVDLIQTTAFRFISD